MKMTVKLSGFRELEKALADLPRATAKNVGRRVLKRAAEPIVAAAEAHAPELSGHLKSVIAQAGSLTARQRKLAGSNVEFVGIAGNKTKLFRSSAKTTVEVHVGPATDAAFKRAPDPAGVLNEFGTSTMAPQPFMRPAWDANKDGALATIESDLGAEVEKAAARVARKAKRGAKG